MRRFAYLLAIPIGVLANPHVRAGEGGDFDERAKRFLHKEYFFHPWRETDHTTDGEDWSLPPWVRAAPYSGISVDERKVGPEFPGRFQRSVRISWREIEPREGEYDFARLRKKILDASKGGRYAVKMGLTASVWQTRWFVSLKDRTVKRTLPGTAPEWMERHDVKTVEEKPNRTIPFQVVNMDIYAPDYHSRYLKLVREFGASGIPRMKELDLCYLHLKSRSRGEEGAGPKPDDPNRKLYEERLRAWAEAFEGVEHKLCNVSHVEADMEIGLKLGMGQRNGFVEHYMLHAPNPMLGQLLDEDGYLVADESNPLIAENRASGDENEEYTRGHETRFGLVDTYPHRYRESMLRVLQMRRNFIWAEYGRWLVNPPLLHYVALELGKNARTAPDAWCYLRETWVPDRPNRNWKRAIPAKNFERWVFQRDAPGARAEPTEKVDVPKQMFEFHKQHLYDYTARKTSIAEGDSRISFAVDERFLAGGPHRVAVKVTYVDRANAEWALEYFVSRTRTESRKVTCGDTGKSRTVTFILEACFPGRGYKGRDLAIRALKGDAVVRFLRVIKLDPGSVEAPKPR
ncbi:MAG: hypothetical protein ACYS9X_08465 [Planctomycetota bacterium]